VTDEKAPDLSVMVPALEHEKPQLVDRLLVCGLPGRRLSAAIELVRRALANATGQCSVINANTLTDAATSDLKSSDGPVLLWADSPDRGIVRWVRTTGTPVFLVDQPFDEVGAEFMVSREAGFSDSARVLALSRIGWWRLAELPTATVLDVSQSVGSGLAVALEQWNVTGSLIPDDADAPSEAATDVAMALSEDNPFTRLAAFYGVPRGADARMLTLDLKLLFDGAPPHAPLSGPIDLTGPVRALTFGPFLYLPQGKWMLHFSFEAGMNRSGNSLMFDVFVDNEAKCATEFHLPHDGQFAFDCCFDVRDPWSTFEFRGHLRRGAIEGVFTPLSLELSRA
jgi:hypothetical protein